MGFSEAQAKVWFKNLGLPFPDKGADKKPVSSLPGGQNKTEAAFQVELESMRLAGDVQWYGFECFNLRLAKKTWYRPDFPALMKDGIWTMWEVKGWMREDARVKIKIAAEKYRMFRFVVVRRIKGRWEYEEIRP